MLYSIQIRNDNKYGLWAVLIILITLCILPYGFGVANTEQEQYIEELIAKSRTMNLSDNQFWHSMLHYKKNYTGGYTSLVDDPHFFFSATGKNNPNAELEATIRGFFTPYNENVIHPTSKFSARYGWLKEQLKIDTAKLPYDGDIRFKQFYEDINPAVISIVFPAGYMNSPASMYGHTLLIIESKGGSRLLARTANYAAITDETFGPIFAVKGLFGLYNGYYSFLPYYQKIKEYSDGEMRDMWEYELNLTPDEIEKMLRHIVEMEDIYSEYYFIDENCSFNLLFLLEAAKPDTRLTDAFSVGVEPIDTLRVIKEKKLVNKRIYRPSNYSKIQYLRTALNNEEQNQVLDFCTKKGDVTAINFNNKDPEKQIIMLDLAAEYLKFLAVKKNITEEDYKSRFLAILSKRNTTVQLDPLKDMPVPYGPEESHRSRKLTPETGTALQGIYSQITYRQSCHELMDPDDGYNMNSQIVFGNISGRYYYENKKLVLHKFDIIDLTSLPPSDSFFFSPCYDFKTGFIQNIQKDKQETLTFQLKGATGLSTVLYQKNQLYFFTGIKSYFSPGYENSSDVLGGFEAGILNVLGPWKSHIFAQIYHSPVNIIHTRYSAGASERIKINNSVSIMADYSYNKDYSFTWHEASVKFHFYF